MHFNGRFVLNLAQFAARQGAAIPQLTTLTGKSIEELSQEQCRLDSITYNAVVEAMLASTQDPFFGLHAGEHLNLSAAGLIAQISQTSETVKQGLEYCCAFANLGCSALPMQLSELDSGYQVTFTPNALWEQQSPAAVKHTAEGFLAFAIREFQSLTLMKHDPVAIHLPWPQPEDITEYERVFRCPVLFNQDSIAMLLQKGHVEAQVVTSDYHLLQVLVAHAEEKSASLAAEQGFASIVRQSVVNLVRPEFPTLEQVAAHLNMSVRTFQRKLHQEGYVFKALIDELRKDFAVSYLKKPELSISEIAYLLSYADASAFIRSFKRWTGQTPKEYRQNLN